MCRPPGAAGRAMVQTYFEAPHSDTDILGRDNTVDTHKYVLTQSRSYPPKGRGKPSDVLHQPSFYSYSSPRPPVNNELISLALAHVPRAQMPPGSVSHARGVKEFMETSKYPPHPNFQHPGRQPDSRTVQVPHFESSGASAGYQNVAELARPDAMIYIYKSSL